MCYIGKQWTNFENLNTPQKMSHKNKLSPLLKVSCQIYSYCQLYIKLAIGSLQVRHQVCIYIKVCLFVILGYGRFQYQLMALCGFIYSCCSLSTTTLSFVLPAAEGEFGLNSAKKGLLNTAPLFGKCEEGGKLNLFYIFMLRTYW